MEDRRLVFWTSESLVNKFNYLFTVKGRFKEKKYVIYNLIGRQFCGKPFFGGK